jgi:hypothetical protein
MDTIIIFTDFEPSSRIAAQFCIQKFGEQYKYLLYHNVGNIMFGQSPYVHLTLDQHIDEVESKLNLLKKDLLNAAGLKNIEVDHAIDVGLAASNVRKIIERKKPVLSVLGMNPKHSEFRLLHSDYASLLQDQNCPVLLVPDVKAQSSVHNILWIDESNQEDREMIIEHLDEIFALDGKALRCLRLDEEVETALHQNQLPNGTRFMLDEFGRAFKNDISAIRAYAAGVNADLLVLPADQGDWLEQWFGNDPQSRLIELGGGPIYILPRHLKQLA